jgi:hypothetical protein
MRCSGIRICFPFNVVTALNRHTLTRRKPYCILYTLYKAVEPVQRYGVHPGTYDAEVAGRTIIGRALYVDPQTLYQPPHPQPTRHTDGQGMRPQAHVGSWSCAFSTCGRDGGRRTGTLLPHNARRSSGQRPRMPQAPKPQTQPANAPPLSAEASRRASCVRSSRVSKAVFLSSCVE